MKQLILTTTTCLALATPLWAVGDESETPPVKTETTTKCEEGMVWNAEKEACVAIEKESNLTDDQIYTYTRELAYAERYEDALNLMAKAAAPEAPRFLTYQGFIHRKLGKMEAATAFYERALAADPSFTLARSYYGQAKLIAGDIEGAKAELSQIAALSGKYNWPYQSLARAIRYGISSDY